MSCPICGKVVCDHSPKERKQTAKEVLEDIKRDWNKEKGKKERIKHKTTTDDTENIKSMDDAYNSRFYPEHYPNLKDCDSF